MEYQTTIVKFEKNNYSKAKEIIKKDGRTLTWLFNKLLNEWLEKAEKEPSSI